MNGWLLEGSEIYTASHDLVFLNQLSSVTADNGIFDWQLFHSFAVMAETQMTVNLLLFFDLMYQRGRFFE